MVGGGRHRNYFPLAFTPEVAGGALPLWQTACRSQIVAASVARARRAQKADLRPRPPPENCSLLASERRTLWLMG